MDRHHISPWTDRASVRASDRDHLIAPKGGVEPLLTGRLDPDAMYPAGLAHVRARRITLPSGLTLRVADAGEAGQPPVLLLHGWGACLYMWRDWFAPLAAAGRRVVAVDLPGHGLSDKPDDPLAYRLGALSAVVREFLEVEQLSNVDVVAQSMAGTIALSLAVEDDSRVHRTVLVNPACFGRVRLQRVARLMSPPIVADLLPSLAARWIIARTHRMVYGDPSRITHRDQDEYWAPSQFRSYARAMRMLVHEFPWSRPPVHEMVSRLRGMKGELLVVLGTKDALIRDAFPYVSQLRAAGARIDVCTVRGGGHAVNEERASEVIEAMLAFLS